MDRISRRTAPDRIKCAAVIAFVISFGACRDATNIVVRNISDVSGRWSYSATNLTGDVSFTCSIQGASMTVSQSGDTLSGSVTGGTLSCLGPNGVTSEALSGGAITNSGINGDIVQINFGKQNIHNVGTVAGNSIFGNVALSGVLGTTALLTGNFSAVRQ